MFEHFNQEHIFGVGWSERWWTQPIVIQSVAWRACVQECSEGITHETLTIISRDVTQPVKKFHLKVSRVEKKKRQKKNITKSETKLNNDNHGDKMKVSFISQLLAINSSWLTFVEVVEFLQSCAMQPRITVVDYFFLQNSGKSRNQLV